MIPGMFQIPDQAGEPVEKRRMQPIQKYTATIGTISGTLLVGLYLQMSAASQQIAALVQFRAQDQAQISAVQSDMRTLTARMAEAFPAYDRRIGDVERTCQETRHDLSSTQNQINAMPPAWQAAIALGQARILDEVRAIVGAEKMRFVPRTLNGESRLISIAEALAKVPGDEPALWTTSGRPTVAAVRSRFGGPVSAGEVEAAWAMLTAAMATSPTPTASAITDFRERTADSAHQDPTP